MIQVDDVKIRLIIVAIRLHVKMVHSVPTSWRHIPAHVNQAIPIAIVPQKLTSVNQAHVNIMQRALIC